MLEYFCWFIVFLLLSLIDDVVTFKCGSHHDECTAGYMYCVVEENRCHNCDDGIYICGVDMPTDCLPYCNHRSREDNDRLQNATILKLQQRNSELQVSIQSWQGGFAAIAGVVGLLTIGLVVYICIRRRKRKHRSHCRSKPADVSLGQQHVENGKGDAPPEEVTALLNTGGSDSAISSSCSVETENERRASEETVSNNQVPRPSSGPALSSVSPEADEYSHHDSQTTGVGDGTTAVDKVSDVRGKTEEEVQREHMSFNGIAPTDGTSNEKAKYACGNNKPMRLNSHTSDTVTTIII